MSIKSALKIKHKHNKELKNLLGKTVYYAPQERAVADEVDKGRARVYKPHLRKLTDRDWLRAEKICEKEIDDGWLADIVTRKDDLDLFEESDVAEYLRDIYRDFRFRRGVDWARSGAEELQLEQRRFDRKWAHYGIRANNFYKDATEMADWDENTRYIVQGTPCEIVGFGWDFADPTAWRRSTVYVKWKNTKSLLNNYAKLSLDWFQDSKPTANEYINIKERYQSINQNITSKITLLYDIRKYRWGQLLPDDINKRAIERKKLWCSYYVPTRLTRSTAKAMNTGYLNTTKSIDKTLNFMNSKKNFITIVNWYVYNEIALEQDPETE